MEIELRLADSGKEVVAQCLVYIDKRRVEQGEPWEEYVHRMNVGINDAAAKGLPGWYIEKYMRGSIPAEGGKEGVETFKPE